MDIILYIFLYYISLPAVTKCHQIPMFANQIPPFIFLLELIELLLIAVYILHILRNLPVMIHPPLSAVMALLLFSVLANLSVNCLGHHDDESGQDTAVYEGIVIRSTRDGHVSRHVTKPKRMYGGMIRILGKRFMEPGVHIADGKLRLLRKRAGDKSNGNIRFVLM